MQQIPRPRAAFSPLFAGLAFVALLAPAPAAAHDAKVKTSFTNTGALPEAAGQLRLRLAPGKARLDLRFAGLTPDAPFTLEAEGVAWETFLTDSQGRARLRFELPPRDASRSLLPADPRGGTLLVHDGSVPVLTAMVSGPGEAADAAVSERGALAASALASDGQASTRFRRRRDRSRLELRLRRAPDGDHAVLFDGVERARMLVNGGSGRLRMDSQPGSDPLLDFDPRDAIVEVTGPSGVVFSGEVRAQVEGLNTCSEAESELQLTASGAGSGESSVEVDDDCEREFELEIEDVPPGSYEVFVGGEPRGTLEVVDLGTEVEGELEFSSDPEGNEALLDFEPVGALIEVRQGDTVFFSGVQPELVPEMEGVPGSAACDEREVSVALLPLGGLPEASGSARQRVDSDCEEEFRVQVEDLPDGTYALGVGGVERTAFEVLAGRAEVEFETAAEEGELPLDFDPAGSLVEVLQGGTPVLGRSFPD